MEQDTDLKKQQGNRLKEARKMLGFQQNEAAEKLGIAAGSYSDIERGKNKLSNEISRKVAQLFGINIVWVMTGEGEPFLNIGDKLTEVFAEHMRQFVAFRRHYVQTVARLQDKATDEIFKELEGMERDVIL